MPISIPISVGMKEIVKGLKTSGGNSEKDRSLRHKRVGRWCKRGSYMVIKNRTKIKCFSIII